MDGSRHGCHRCCGMRSHHEAASRCHRRCCGMRSRHVAASRCRHRCHGCRRRHHHHCGVRCHHEAANCCRHRCYHCHCRHRCGVRLHDEAANRRHYHGCCRLHYYEAANCCRRCRHGYHHHCCRRCRYFHGCCRHPPRRLSRPPCALACGSHASPARRLPPSREQCHAGRALRGGTGWLAVASPARACQAPLQVVHVPPLQRLRCAHARVLPCAAPVRRASARRPHHRRRCCRVAGGTGWWTS